MQTKLTTEQRSIPVKDGTVILSGYSVSAKTEKGFLCLHYGCAEDQHTAKYSPATCKIKRLVILGHDGYITLAALKWLFDIGAGIIQIGLDGEIILASAPHREHIAIKRAQYAAVDNQNGWDITTYLVTRKAYGQAQVLSKYAHNATCTYQGDTLDTTRFIKSRASEIKQARSIPEVLVLEGIIAVAYWDAISKIYLRFKKKDSKYLPNHWLTFGARHSLINPKVNRNATNPANAMLNYLYALLYAETCIALLGVGLDPYAGIIHQDNPYRASFAYDVMEAARSEVDAWLLDFVSSYTFSRHDFYHKPDGGVRVCLPLARRLAETASLWRAAVIEPVHKVRGRLAR